MEDSRKKSDETNLTKFTTSLSFDVNNFREIMEKLYKHSKNLSDLNEEETVNACKKQNPNYTQSTPKLMIRDLTGKAICLYENFYG